ncbi:MAG: arsenosugar biosynthesis radical SAM (seleno)protein ArsS [Thermodesulfobacteriota bacterium]
MQSMEPGTEEATTFDGETFHSYLDRQGLSLTRQKTETLQVNLGLYCNQACKHCHLDAGPHRREQMDSRTLEETADYARRGGFRTIDITGGAPELHSGILPFVRRIREMSPDAKIMLRSNLSALLEQGLDSHVQIFREAGVDVVASMPAYNRQQLEAQRGQGVFSSSIQALQGLNKFGYGQAGTGLELDLIVNPAGAFLPPDQKEAEDRFRNKLQEEYGISFNRVFSMANVPMGRFKSWLEEKGLYRRYMQRLAGSFNSCALEGVMCRSLVSVGWNGYLYDCDFNLALGIPMGGKRVHVSEMSAPPAPGSRIVTGNHCYTCTAGSGST